MKFLKSLIKSLAYKILEKDLRNTHIRRCVFNEYTKWMSRDHKVMEDMHFHFDRFRGYELHDISGHRERMKEKHLIGSQ